MRKFDLASPKVSIAYVNESLGPGGAEGQLVELVKHLDRERFDVRIMTYWPDDFHLPELERLGVPVRRLRRKGKWDLRPVVELARWLRSGQVDLVHAYLNTANLYAVLARILAGRGKVVVSERSVEHCYAGLRRLYRNWAYRRADAIIVNSSAARAELMDSKKLNDKRVLFIPNGIDMERYHPVDSETRLLLRRKLGWSPGERIMLTVASYKPPKNHLGIADALAGLDGTGTPLRFHWVGQPESPEMFSQIEKRIAELNLQDVIHISGPRSDIVDLYRACDVLILNSLWEGMPNVVLEALACGCPVIATDVSDVSRYVIPGLTGWLIPPGDADALRMALDQVSQMSEQDLRETGVRGRQHLLGLGVDSNSLARRHEQVYIELLGKN